MVVPGARQSRPFGLAAVTMMAFALACGAADGADGSAGQARGSDAELASPGGGPDADATESADLVVPGVDVLFRDSLHLVRGLRVGLITNPTGVDAAGRSTIDRLFEHPEVELVALFAPEHGLRAAEGEGQHIEDSTDPATGLPVISLYSGSKRAPTAADLQGIDALLFDMQDIGARYYTYVYTMALSMEAAGAAGVPFVVLDRPNPIGGAVQGNVLDPAYSTFVGMYPIPMRHGLTAGELARLFRGEFGVEAELTVVPVEGWRASMGFDDTALPWIPPSPNIPTLASARHYPGTCLFEGTNLSVGRGTSHPFQQVGAPWLDGPALAARLNGLGLDGVRFEPVTFTPFSPTDGKWADTEVEGVRLVETDPNRYDPTGAAVALLVEAHRMAGAEWAWNVTHFDRLSGSDELRRGVDSGTEATQLTERWTDALRDFDERVAPYRIYDR